MANITAYMRIRNYVVDSVFSHPDVDARIMSERELCAKFGVTRPTARKALKDLIDDGWLHVKPGRGMFVNREQGRSSHFSIHPSKKIIAIFGDGRIIDFDPFLMDILARICDTLKQLSARLKIVSLSCHDDDLADELSAYNPDGILWLRPPAKLHKAITQVRKRIPVHIVGDIPSGKDHATTMDYRQAGRISAAWFLDRGRRDVAFVGHNEAMQVKNELFHGWAEEFATRGADYDSSLRFDMRCDITSALMASLRTKMPEGVFSFGSEFAAVDQAMIKAGTTSRSCPVLIDENRYATMGAKTAPAAKLILFPPELPALAAKRLFHSLSAPDVPVPEMVLAPTIQEA